MASIFTGWLGYGTTVQGGVLNEPSDTAYARQIFSLGDLDSGIASNTVGGTVGPASSSWGTIAFAGVFDAPLGGSLLFSMALERPIVVGPSTTITIARNDMRFTFPDLRGRAGMTMTWSAGATIGEIGLRRPVVAGVPLQFSANLLSAQTAVLGSTIVMGSIPNQQPSAGSGQLWNNGGIISIA